MKLYVQIAILAQACYTSFAFHTKSTCRNFKLKKLAHHFALNEVDGDNDMDPIRSRRHFLGVVPQSFLALQVASEITPMAANAATDVVLPSSDVASFDQWNEAAQLLQVNNGRGPQGQQSRIEREYANVIKIILLALLMRTSRFKFEMAMNNVSMDSAGSRGDFPVQVGKTSIENVKVVMEKGRLPLIDKVAFWSKNLRLGNLRPPALDSPTTSSDDDIHSYYMSIALQQARRAAKKGEVPIGAVIVQQLSGDKYRIVAQAHNLVETKGDASAHAEMLALKQAARNQKNWRLQNATIYTTLEPCPMCLAACQAFRVQSIVYGAPDLRLGAIETHVKLLEIPHPYHTINPVVSGIGQEESAELLRDFFQKRRKETKFNKRQPTWRSALSQFFRRRKK